MKNRSSGNWTGLNTRMGIPSPALADRQTGDTTTKGRKMKARPKRWHKGIIPHMRPSVKRKRVYAERRRGFSIRGPPFICGRGGFSAPFAFLSSFPALLQNMEVPPFQRGFQLAEVRHKWGANDIQEARLAIEKDALRRFQESLEKTEGASPKRNSWMETAKKFFGD